VFHVEVAEFAAAHRRVEGEEGGSEGFIHELEYVPEGKWRTVSHTPPS